MINQKDLISCVGKEMKIFAAKEQPTIYKCPDMVKAKLCAKNCRGCAYTIVTKKFCEPMRIRGLCTGVCKECEPALKHAFAMENPINPVALLIWILKREVAIQAENRSNQKAPIKIAKDKYGIPTSENPFDTLLKELA